MQPRVRMQRPRLVLLPAFAILTLGAGFARADINADLDALTAAGSDGGAAITDAEAATFAAGASAYGADDAILGLVHAHGLRMDGSFPADSAYATINQALRFRVDGLAVSKRQAPGIRFARASTTAPIEVTFDSQGVDYTQVDLVFTWDAWTTARGVTLSPNCHGDYTAILQGAPANGTFAYSLHLFGPDGSDLWTNNPRELGIYGGQSYRNYDLQLAAMTATPAEPTKPAFAQLLRTFADPRSLGGATVTSSEFSELVQEITWEGGTGVEHRAALRPALDELYDLESEGVTFEVPAANLRDFLTAQMTATATYPSAFYQRAADGRLTMTIAEPSAASARVYYSTDGWNIPHVTSCSRPEPGAALSCDLGYLLPGALWSYTIATTDADGNEHWIRSTLGNFFEELRY